MKKKFLGALRELRNGRKRNFIESVDLIINLKDFNPKIDSLNIFVTLPFETKEKKVCAFLEKPNKNFDLCITKQELPKFQNKKEIKKIVKNYDFFVSLASLMPAVATTFGRYLGPAGKMPSPQLGIIQNDDEKNIKEIIEKIKRITKIKTKEASIKVMIGKEDMSDEELSENALTVYSSIVDALPKRKENIKNIMLKFTMSKPIKIGK